LKPFGGAVDPTIASFVSYARPTTTLFKSMALYFDARLF
jgi:hypothetical protein